MENNRSLGIVQMSCSDMPAENLERALKLTRAAADHGANSRMPARTISFQVLLPG